MRLRYNSRMLFSGVLIAAIAPGIALLAALQANGPARYVLWIVTIGVSAILASAFIWGVLLTRTYVNVDSLVVVSPFKTRIWGIPTDVVSILDSEFSYKIRFGGPAGVYVFRSGIFQRDGSLKALDECVTKARSRLKNA